jgi:hypothetical protein
VSALPPDAVVDSDDDGDLFVVTPRVRIDADHACFRRLGWRCALVDAGLDPLGAAPGMIALGYTRVDRAAGLVELRHPRGHTVLLVARSKRIQLRLDVETPADERVATAVELAEALAESARGSKGTPECHSGSNSILAVESRK